MQSDLKFKCWSHHFIDNYGFCSDCQEVNRIKQQQVREILKSFEISRSLGEIVPTEDQLKLIIRKYAIRK